MKHEVWRFTRVLMCVAALALAACSGSGEPRPPDIAYGRDMCDQCGMIIDDERFASALVLQDGKTLIFDDAGEMFAYYGKHQNTAISAWFVHDYASKAWISGEKAYYVVSAQVRSPMGTGVAAFAESAAAEAFRAEVNGKLLTFDEARTELVGMGH